MQNLHDSHQKLIFQDLFFFKITSCCPKLTERLHISSSRVLVYKLQRNFLVGNVNIKYGSTDKPTSKVCGNRFSFGP